MNPSKEQQDIINKSENFNIVVNAVVGGGKSSIIFFLAKQKPHETILLLTYNKRLRLDTKERFKNAGITNVEVHSFHSFFYAYYSSACTTDSELLNVINKKQKPIKPFRNFSMFITDEFQDCTPLYFEIVCKFNADFKEMNKRPLRFMVIGDIRQSIYQYNNSDSRYITEASKIFPNNNKPWISCNLTETFRLTKHITNFVNGISDSYKTAKIISNKGSSIKVRYVIANQFHIASEVFYYLKKGFKYDDIFILAPSVKNGPVKFLANSLSNKDIPIHIPMSDNDSLDADLTSGKICMVSYHQSKGTERPVVIVLGFDSSYFKYYNKSAPKDQLSNELFVGITRASHSLSVIQHYEYKQFDFVQDIYNSDSISVISIKNISIKKEPVEEPVSRKQISATDLIRHIPIDIVEKAYKFLTVKRVRYEHDNDVSILNIPLKTSQKFNGTVIYENVSDINGIAIPSYYEFITQGKMTIKENLDMTANNKFTKKLKKLEFCAEADIIERDLSNEKISINMFDTDHEDTAKDPAKETVKNCVKYICQNSIEELLYLSNKWSAVQSNFIHKTNQISNYSWLSQDILDKTVSRLGNRVSKDALYEVPFSSDSISGYNIGGFVDCIDKETVWEFKCTSEIDKGHYIQLAIYKFLIDTNEEDSLKKYRLFNILSNEIYSISASLEDLFKMINVLIEYKYNTPITQDIDFLKNNLEITRKY